MAACAPYCLAVASHGFHPAYVADLHAIASETALGSGPYLGNSSYVGLKGYVARPFVTEARCKAPALNGCSDITKFRKSVDGRSDLIGWAAPIFWGGTSL